VTVLRATGAAWSANGQGDPLPDADACVMQAGGPGQARLQVRGPVDQLAEPAAVTAAAGVRPTGAGKPGRRAHRGDRMVLRSQRAQQLTS
jgi:hypothetical protein